MTLALVIGSGTVAGLLVAFLIALLIGAIIYYVGIYLFHAPQQPVAIVAFLFFIVIFLLLLQGNVNA